MTLFHLCNTDLDFIHVPLPSPPACFVPFSNYSSTLSKDFRQTLTILFNKSVIWNQANSLKPTMECGEPGTHDGLSPPPNGWHVFVATPALFWNFLSPKIRVEGGACHFP